MPVDLDKPVDAMTAEEHAAFLQGIAAYWYRRAAIRMDRGELALAVRAQDKAAYHAALAMLTMPLPYGLA